jgi:histidyl-tRNA synthetase
MARPRPPRGTHDLIGEEQRRHRLVVETARRVAATLGYEEWATPIFEETQVFARSLGETSDVVAKEMYTFTDRSGDSLTLRPEGTAGVCRALVTNGLTQSLPQRVFYAGPMFRYERPQKGRFRQFHQIGIELLGPSHPLADAEAVLAGHLVLEALGLGDGVRLELNTLGDPESRARYREALVAYFQRFAGELSEDSRRRLEKNPLRILDSKDEGDRALIAGAPLIGDFLTPEAARHFERVKQFLTAASVPFVENPRIVRGLDYYSHTAFEFITDRLGAQGTVMAGGRYQGLIAEMGGPAEAGGVGWAAGVERLALLIAPPDPPPAPVALIAPLGGEEEAAEAARPAIALLAALARAGITAAPVYAPLKRALARAAEAGARVAVILGSPEAEAGAIVVRDLAARAQRAVTDIEAAVAAVAEILRSAP